MEKYITWYWFWLKAWLKKKTCWLQIAAMILLVLLALNISFPTAWNVTAGVCNEDGDYAEELIQNLKNKEGLFNYQSYESREALQQDVISGKIECGFVIEKDFEKKLREGSQKEAVTILCTPFSSKYMVIREAFYSAMLEQYSNFILEQSEKEIFKVPDEKRTRRLLEKNKRYLEGDEIFHLNIENVHTEKKRLPAKPAKVYPVQALVGTLLLTALVLAAAGKTPGFARALNQKESRIFELLGSIAHGTVIAAVGTVIICCSRVSRGVITETVAMVMLLIVSGLWMIVLKKVLKNRQTLGAGTMTLILLNLLGAPAIVDFSSWIPALKYISYLLPLGIYLRI